MIEMVLSGDVMLGRGVDQVLRHSCPPHLHERWVRSAREYVALAESRNGPIPAPVEPTYVWGDGLEAFRGGPSRIGVINLETSVTTSEDAFPKGINYRMHPGNVEVLTAAEIDCCVLANNHVLDWGVSGLLETLEVLHGAGIRVAGAGRDSEEAAAPAVIPAHDDRRILVVGCCTGDSGVPPEWEARPGRPGVNRLPDLSRETARRIGRRVQEVWREGDVIVASIHWGPNWGYRVPGNYRRFARELIDLAGVDVVHGHSSHHPKGIEMHRERPILYGCGDLINDYEGIGGRESFRDDLVCLYLLTLEDAGALQRLEMIPMRLERFRLGVPPEKDLAWLHARMRRECRKLGSDVERAGNRFSLQWS